MHPRTTLSFIVFKISRFYESSRDTYARSHWFRIYLIDGKDSGGIETGYLIAG